MDRRRMTRKKSMKKGRWMLVLIVCGASSVSLKLAQKLVDASLAGVGSTPAYPECRHFLEIWGENTS
jgi:hypothetical protein